MKQIVQIAGAVYGALSVILGAFGAHALKQVLELSKIQSFETGVRYQMYHAIVLIIIGFYLPFTSQIEKWIGWSLIIGVFLFSFSIYFLALSPVLKINLSFLGPVTPLGGLAMILGWVLLVVHFVKYR